MKLFVTCIFCKKFDSNYRGKSKCPILATILLAESQGLILQAVVSITS